MSAGAAAARTAGAAPCDQPQHDARRLDLFVTEACNFACGYCFAATLPRPSPSPERARAAIDWLMRSRSPRVHLTLWGGEPLLRRPLVLELVAHARARAAECGKRVTFSMPTNASLLDDETLAALRALDVELFLSIDGDEVGQQGRPLRAGGSSHALVDAALRRAMAGPREGRPAVRMTISPENAGRLARDVRYLVEAGAPRILAYPAMDRPWSEAALEAHRRGQLELAELVEERVREADDPRAVARIEPLFGTARRLLDGVTPRAREGKVRHCGAGETLVALTVEGTFVPCHRFAFYGRARGEAQVAQGDLDEGLFAAPAAAGVGLEVGALEGETRCADCAVFDLCTFGCTAISYASSGRPDRIPAAACALIRAQIEAAERLHDRLGGDARWALYLGEGPRRALRRAARTLARRAREVHRGA